MTFCTVWALRVDFIFAEMVVGTSRDFPGGPIVLFLCGAALDHFSLGLEFGKALAFVKCPFCVLGITAMPLLE